MLKFFRHIRQNLFLENKTGKSVLPAGRYLKYAIGEIILVVVGILIALQTQLKCRKKTNTRLEYCEQLLEDLKKDKEFAEQAIEILLQTEQKITPS